MRHLWIIGCIFALIFSACREDDTPPPPPPCDDCDPDWVLDETPYEWKNYPTNFPDPKFFTPEDNPLTAAKVNLGKKLFYDPLLSRDYTVSCASCHDPQKAFSDPRKLSPGVDGRLGTRHSMALMNLMFSKKLFWDGGKETLEEQALVPIEADFEMDNTVEEVVRRLRADTAYQRLFYVAFGKEADADALAKAITSFERILVSGNTRYDDFVRTRNPNVMTPSEQRGMAIFTRDERADCFHCHASAVTFNDDILHDSGLEFLNGDTGRELVTGNPSDRLKFKTVTVRNLVFTAPYMHDGRFNTLEEVIEHYMTGGANRPTQSAFVPPEAGPNLLSDQEKQDLIAFLKVLSDSSFVNNPEYLP